MNGFWTRWVLVVLMSVGVAAGAYAQGVTFSLDGEGVGGQPTNLGNPWAVYWSTPVTGIPGTHVGITPPPVVYLPPDDNLDALYNGGTVVAPIQVVLFSLDERQPAVEIYRSRRGGQKGSVPTGVTERSLGLLPNSNVDGFDHLMSPPDAGLPPGDYSVDDPDPVGAPPPPGESEDIYFPAGPLYQNFISGVGAIGLNPTDNIDAWTYIPGSPHPLGNIFPAGGTPNWPTGALFSVEPGGGSGLDPGDIYWTDFNANNPRYFVYMDDVKDLLLPDEVDVDAVSALGVGTPPPWFDAPEPSTWVLLMLGLLIAPVLGRRR